MEAARENNQNEIEKPASGEYRQNFDVQTVVDWLKSGVRMLGRLWVWTAYAIGSIFLGIIVIAVIIGLISGNGSNEQLASERYVSGSGLDKIAVIPLDGVIGAVAAGPLADSSGITVESVRADLDQARKDPLVKGVILKINSPGGSAVVSDQIYQLIVDFKEDTGKSVVASFGDTAASGGYYIGSAADKIVANPATLTGSIGVIMELYNASGLLDNIGVRSEVIKSGPYKDIGSFTRGATDTERSILQSVVDDAFDQFVDRVAEGREMDRQAVEELADGRIFTGSQAVENGLVDGVGNINSAIAMAESLANISNATVVEYKRGGWFESILGVSQAINPLSSLNHIAPQSSVASLQYRWYP